MLNQLQQVRAFAPATCGNVIVGFDSLGLAISGVGDEVTLTRRDDDKLVIEQIDGNDAIPTTIDKNVSAAVVERLRQDLGLTMGFSIHLNKGIPMSSGMGGSAASAVAALVAFNAFLQAPLSLAELANYALYGESLCSGQAHADNAIPALYGGIVLTQQLEPLQVATLPIPSIYCVVVHPQLTIATRDARAMLSEQVPLRNAVQQSIYLASFIRALYEDDVAALSHCLQDVMIEPQRKHLIPQFEKIKQSALDKGALGMSLSGSGPSLLAFASNKTQAEAIAKAMQAVLAQQKIASEYYCSPINPQGAMIIASQ